MRIAKAAGGLYSGRHDRQSCAAIRDLQKDRKFKRRAFGAVPIIGSLETVRGVGNYLYKKATGTQRNLRHHAACWLTAHLASFDCMLVQAIVAELYSRPEMGWLRGQEYRTAIEHIERKSEVDLTTCLPTIAI